MSSKVKVAVVGASGYGDSYLQTLLHDPRNAAIEFVGVADPASQRCRRFELLKSRGIPFFPSLEVMLASRQEIDLVALATPIHLHAPHACLALARGANVLCEKPLAGSLADAKRMLHAALEHEVSAEREASLAQEALFLAIGFQWSYSEPVQRLKRDIAGGLFGKPRRLKCLVSFPRGHDYYSRNDWAGRVKTLSGKDVLDSPVNNSTAHYLHNMLYVLGPTRETSAVPAKIQAELYRANSIENYDTGALRIVTEGGAGGAAEGGVEVLFLSTQAMTQRVGPISSYEFEHATVTHDSTTGAGDFVASFHSGPHAGTVKNYGNPDADRNEKLWHSVAAVHSGAAPACGVRSALAHTLCVLAAHKSCPVIRVVPASELLSASVGDDIIVTIRDLGRVMRDCFDAAKLPSELGTVSWAQSTPEISVPHTDLLAPDYRPVQAAVV